MKAAVPAVIPVQVPGHDARHRPFQSPQNCSSLRAPRQGRPTTFVARVATSVAETLRQTDRSDPSPDDD
jgi:hypothetical protein